MDWMSNLFVILLLTTMTGTVFCVVGFVLRMLWFRKDVGLLRIQMRMMLWAFVVPFVAAVLYFRAFFARMTAGIADNLFYNTSGIERICAGLGCIWLTSFLVLLGYKLCVRYKWMRVFRGNIPEEDAETEAMFSEICERLGIAGQVSLYRNDLIEMPCITYSHGFVVVLPLECYTAKETAVIFYHELCHYLNGDIYLKTGSCIVSLLHVLNPVAHILLKRLSLVCEECCDRLACEKGAETFSRSEYFRTILNVLTDEGKRERYNLFLLADTIGDYERRVQSMREYREHGGFRKGTAAVLTACFLLGSSMTALAAGDSMMEAYKDAADVTASKAEEAEGANIMETMAVSGEELLEEFARAYDLDPDSVVMMGDEGIETIGNAIYVEWNIPAGETYMTGNFREEIGNKVSVMTVGSPSSIRYQMGLKDPNDLMRYVEGTGDMAHSFSITVKGGHCFFVTNLGSQELSVRGTVMK